MIYAKIGINIEDKGKRGKEKEKSDNECDSDAAGGRESGSELCTKCPLCTKLWILL